MFVASMWSESVSCLISTAYVQLNREQKEAKCLKISSVINSRKKDIISEYYWLRNIKKSWTSSWSCLMWVMICCFLLFSVLPLHRWWQTSGNGKRVTPISCRFPVSNNTQLNSSTNYDLNIIIELKQHFRNVCLTWYGVDVLSGVSTSTSPSISP